MKLLTIAITLFVLAQAVAVQAVDIPKYGIFQVTLTASGSYSNHYLMMPGDNTTPGFVVGTFTGPGGAQIQVDGFWDGGSTWKLRITPTVVGTWSYTTSSADAGLNGKTGSFNCIASTSKGFPKVDPNGRHHFMWSDGTPFYLAGVCTIVSNFDSRDAQGGSRRVDNGTFQALLDIRKTQRFTLGGGCSAFNKPQWNQKTQANEGGPPFTNYDPTELNPAYHQYLDLRVAAVVDREMICEWMIGFPDQNIFANIGHPNIKRYWRYIIARYSAYNVMWNLFGEVQEIGSDYLQVADDYASLTRAYDPYNHLLTTHTAGDLSAEFCNRAWLDVIQLQRPPDSVSAYLGYNKPIWDPEFGGYEGPDGGASQIRPLTWQVLMFGGHYLYESWGNDPVSEAATHMKWLNQFMQDRTRFWRLEYHPELFGSKPALADPGWEYVIYLQTGGSVTVNLSAASGTLSVEWYNPRTGQATSAGSVAGGGSQNFTAPDGNDWALHISKPLVPEIISIGNEEAMGTFNGRLPTIAVDSLDQPHAAFDGGSYVYFYDKINGVWQEIGVNELSYTGSGQYYNPHLEIDKSNNRAWCSGILFGNNVFGLGVIVRSNMSTSPSPVTTIARVYIREGSWDAGELSTDPGRPDEVICSSSNGEWHRYVYNAGAPGLISFVNEGAMYAGQGGEKNAFWISKAGNVQHADSTSHAVWHGAIGGWDNWDSSYQNSIRAAQGLGTVKWAAFSQYPTMNDDGCYVDVVSDNKEPQVAYIACDFKTSGGICVNIWNGTSMLFPINNLLCIDVNGTSGLRRFAPQLCAAKDGGAWICWTRDSRIKVRYIAPDGSMGSEVDVGAGTKGAICADSQGNLHVAYNNGASKYRKLYVSGALVDTEPPSVPANVQASALSKTSIKVTWTASTDNKAVKGYTIFRNGVPVGTYIVPSDGSLVGPFTPGYGNWNTLNNGGFETANPSGDPLNPPWYLWTGGSQGTFERSNQRAAVGSYSAKVTPTAIWYNVRLQDVTVISGQQYVLSGFFYTGGATGHVYLDLNDIANNPTVGTTMGIGEWQFGWKEFTAASSGVTVRIVRGLDTNPVYYDDVAITPAGQFVPPAPLSYTDTGLQPGTTYSYTVSAYDAAGNESAQSSPPATATTPADTQAPSVPTNVTATVQSSSSIRIAWTASTDDVGVVGYKIYRNGGQAATSATTSYLDTGLQPETTYSYTVSAYDSSGNESAQSSPPTTARTPVQDTQSPSVPTNVQASPQSPSSINVTWTASTDNVGVTGYKIYRNGSQVGTSATTSYLDTGLQQGTTYSYRVSAYDADGNASGQSTPPAVATPPDCGDIRLEAESFNAAYDTTSGCFECGCTVNPNNPNVDLEYQAAEGCEVAIIAAGEWLQWNNVQTCAATYKIQIRIASKQPPTGKSCHIEIDSVNTGTINIPNTGSWTTWTTVDGPNVTLLPGSHTVKQVSDTDGYNINWVQLTFVSLSDTEPPSVPTNVQATGLSSSSIQVTWTASTDNFAVTGYKVFRNGGQVVTTASTSYTDTGLSANTTYSYTISAYDTTGNNSAQSSPPTTGKTLAGDTTPPSVPTNVTATTLSTTSIQVTWTASTDNVAVKGYYVYRNGSYLATSTTTTFTNNGLTPNTVYSYTVAAYDAARNVSVQSSPPATAKTLSNDTQPPSVPTNVQSVSETPRQVKVTWTASTDNVGVTGYKVFRNSSQIGTSAAISYADTGLTPSTSYSYTVSAYDTSDNNSAQSSPPVTVITMTAIDIDAAKAMADWLQVGMVSKTVTAIYSGCFYVEETSKYTGIKVIPLEMPGGLAIGGIVDVGGTMRTENGERYMANAAVTTQ